MTTNTSKSQQVKKDDKKGLLKKVLPFVPKELDASLYVRKVCVCVCVCICMDGCVCVCVCWGGYMY